MKLLIEPNKRWGPTLREMRGTMTKMVHETCTIDNNCPHSSDIIAILKSPSTILHLPAFTPTHLVGPAGCAGVLESTRTRRSIASGRRVSLRSASRRLSGRDRSLPAIFPFSARFCGDVSITMLITTTTTIIVPRFDCRRRPSPPPLPAPPLSAMAAAAAATITTMRVV